MSTLTPRTDERVKFVTDQLKQGSEEILTDHPYYVLDQLAGLSRTLERELSAAREELKAAIDKQDALAEEVIQEKILNSQLEDSVEWHEKGHLVRNEKIASLTAQVEGMRKDAERYQWINAQDHFKLICED